MTNYEKETALSGAKATASANTAVVPQADESGFEDGLTTPAEQHSDILEISAREERAFVCTKRSQTDAKAVIRG
jgi:hypothetical protein